MKHLIFAVVSFFVLLSLLIAIRLATYRPAARDLNAADDYAARPIDRNALRQWSLTLCPLSGFYWREHLDE